MVLIEGNKEKAGRHAIAWDPSHSSLLHVVSAPDPSSLSVYQFYANVGVAAGSDREFSTLLRLISDYETNCKSSNISIRLQSQQYRESIQECLREYSKTDTADILQRNLLSEILSVFRLAEIYILPATSFMSDNNYESSSRSWLECPGIATADTIRFLRHYIFPPLEGMEEEKDSTHNMDEDMIDEDEQQRMTYPNDVQEKDLYWSLAFSLVCRGCLASAWDLLKTHTIYTTAFDGVRLLYMNEESRALSQATLLDWEQIGSVLLTAPLPGGRSTEHDTGTASASNQSEVAADNADISLAYVSGMDVSYMDFVLWDIPSDCPEDYPVIAYAGDYPILFSPELAMQKYRLWHDFAIHVRQTNRLCRQIPHIDHLFQLLCGDWTTTKTLAFPFSSWSEQLCAELLYRTPDLRPRSIASRTRKLMRDFQEENESTNPIVSIMQGNAGRAMTELNELGGRSGAALPTTLVRRLFPF
jgi:Nup85 Nucleoporin